MWRGTSPVTLKPRTDITNPVLTCASIPTQPISFVADPFLVIPSLSGPNATTTTTTTTTNTHFSANANVDVSSAEASASAEAEAEAEAEAAAERTSLDPHPPMPGGVYYAFYEMKNLGRRSAQMGELGVAMSSDSGRVWSHVGTALSESFHLSYPNVWWHTTTKQWLMLPETGSVQQIRLYTTSTTQFPLGWRLHQVLVDSSSGR
jgi:hypothetical protein